MKRTFSHSDFQFPPSLSPKRYHTPPRLGMPDVQLELPKDRPLKSVIERLRTISPQGKRLTPVFLERDFF